MAYPCSRWIAAERMCLAVSLKDWDTLKGLAQVHTVGNWNLMEITAQGENVEVRVNGALTAWYKDPAPGVGHVAFQRAEVGTIRFRNPEIEN